jgi:small membrane protein
MKVVLIQIVLIAAVVLVAGRMLRGRDARTQALRRLGLLVFAAFAVWSILFPTVWNRIAHAVGVGRGTDMVLYALVVAFLSFTLTTYLRFREIEARYTKLARRLALDEVAPPRPAIAASRDEVPGEQDVPPAPGAGQTP